MLSMHLPRPSMLMAIWRSANSAVNFSLVNCDPWSLLKMSGRPRRNARFSASTQNSTSIVSDSDQLSTNRLNQSIDQVEAAWLTLSRDERSARLCGAIHGRGSGLTSALSSKCLRNRNLQVTENIDAIFYPLKRSAVRLRSGQGLVRSFSARPSTNGLPARFLIVAGPRPITMSCAGAGRNITQPFKWMLILYRCWKDHRPYSEEVYLASLAEQIGRAHV